MTKERSKPLSSNTFDVSRSNTINIQESVFDESLNMLDRVNEELLDCIVSFMGYPEVHNNTIIVYDQILKLKNMLKEQNFYPSRYRNPLAVQSHPKVQLYYRRIDEMKIYADMFEELLRPLKGYISAGLSQEQMTILDQLFRQCGWEITLLNVGCQDACFYEYQQKGCNLMFVKNNLAPADYRRAIYNNIEVTFTYAGRYPLGGSYYVGGGKYRLIQFQDDENIKYSKLIKTKSERK